MSLCVQSLTNFFPHFYSNRREALLLPSLQQGVCGQVQSQGSPTDPFGCEKIPMQELLQNLLQDVSSAQTWGIWLLCSTLNWDTFSTTTKKTNEREKTPSSLSSLLFFLPKPRRTVRESHQSGFVHKFTDFFFFSSSTGRFHFRVRNSSVLASLSFQAVFLWLQSVSSFVKPCTHLPVLFMHFSACLEVLYAFTMLSTVFVPMSLSMAVKQFIIVSF